MPDSIDAFTEAKVELVPASTSKLLPCPFCGSACASLNPLEIAPYKFYITCVCGAQMGSHHDVDRAFFEEEIVSAWNARRQGLGIDAPTATGIHAVVIDYAPFARNERGEVIVKRREVDPLTSYVWLDTETNVAVEVAGDRSGAANSINHNTSQLFAE